MSLCTALSQSVAFNNRSIAYAIDRENERIARLVFKTGRLYTYPTAARRVWERVHYPHPVTCRTCQRFGRVTADLTNCPRCCALSLASERRIEQQRAQRDMLLTGAYRAIPTLPGMLGSPTGLLPAIAVTTPLARTAPNREVWSRERQHVGHTSAGLGGVQVYCPTHASKTNRSGSSLCGDCDALRDVHDMHVNVTRYGQSADARAMRDAERKLRKRARCIAHRDSKDGKVWRICPKCIARYVARANRPNG